MTLVVLQGLVTKLLEKGREIFCAVLFSFNFPKVTSRDDLEQPGKLLWVSFGVSPGFVRQVDRLIRYDPDV